MAADEELLAAVDLLYQAAADPDAWPAAIAAVAGPLGATIGVAIWVDQADPSGFWFRQHGGDPAAADLYLRELAPLDPWILAYQHPRYREGDVATGDELIAPASLRRTRFAADLLARVDAFQLLTGYAVRQGTRQSFLGLLRPERAPEFGEAERRLHALLLPHFRRVLWLQQRLALADAQETALDRLAFGLLLLDGQGRVLFANRAAQATLARGDGLALRAGRLSAVDARAAAALDPLLRAVAAPDPRRPASAGGVLALPRPSGKLPWRLIASPLPHDLALGLPAGGRARVLLVVSDPERVPTPPLEQLRHLLGLTPQEARLALLLAGGSELKDAAERLGVGYETARTHLRSALAKAGVRRQGQLVAQVVASAVLRNQG